MPTFDFRTLGSIDLRPSDGGPSASILTQPKRLGLIAYLVLSRPRGRQSRDRLLPLFWPELDEARARGALSQSLYVLRQALGEETIQSHGNHEVLVNRSSLVSDVERFEELIATNEPEAAFSMYAGELLPGLHVPGCVELSQWLDVERARVRRMARDTAADLAAAESERTPGAAVLVLHRALELFPTDEGLFRSLVEVLARTGDRVGVERAYGEFRQRLREHWDTEPAEETRRLVERATRDRPQPSAAGSAERPAIRSIGVLPLRSAGLEIGRYTSESMTEALIGELGRIRALRVVSHQSVLRFRDSTRSLAEIAELLDVDALVEGMVTESGDRVRVSAQLVRAAPEQSVWSGAFEAEPGDVLTMHREIARAIAEAVSAALTQEEQAYLVSRDPVEPDAYEAYLQGWTKHATAIPVEIARAAELYTEAIRLDPTFPPPRAFQAVIYFTLVNFGELPERDVLPLMERSVEHAAQLNPDIWQVRTARGLLHMLRHDWRAAEEDLSRAVQLAPNEPTVHAEWAVFLTGMGRFEEAREAAEAASRVAPLTPFAQWISGWTSHYAGRPDDGVRRLRRCLKLFPDEASAWLFLAKCHHQLDDRAEARQACRRALELMPENPSTLAYTTHILAASGAPVEAGEVMARLQAEWAKRGFSSSYYAAAALCGLGRDEEAMEELGRIDKGTSATAYLLPTDPLLDPLRDDPRFDEVLERVGLGEWPYLD